MNSELLTFSGIAFIVVLCYFAGVALGSALAAMMLRAAAYVLRMRDIPFAMAFRSTLIANGTLAALGLLMGFNQGLMLGPMGPRGGPFGGPFSELHYLSLLSSPSYVMFTSVAGLLFAALVYHKTLPRDSQGHALSYTDALLLAAVTSALTVVALAFIVLAVMSTLSLLVDMPGLFSRTFSGAEWGVG